MDEDELDPRIQVELEKLNTATDEINKLEIELDEANTTFRMLLNECTRRLKVHSSRYGGAIVSARPYYEALEVARAAQQECQRAAVAFQRANEVHEAAKETVSLAEARFASQQPEWRFDSAWQEMLNHATLKVRDAEKQRAESAAYHGQATARYKLAQDKVQQLEQRLHRNVSKSRPYFEEKARCNDQLAAQKGVVEALQKHVAEVKGAYAGSLRRLEGISEEIHRKRAGMLEACRGVREPGVGAELAYEDELADLRHTLDAHRAARAPDGDAKSALAVSRSSTARPLYAGGDFAPSAEDGAKESDPWSTESDELDSSSQTSTINVEEAERSLRYDKMSPVISKGADTKLVGTTETRETSQDDDRDCDSATKTRSIESTCLGSEAQAASKEIEPENVEEVKTDNNILKHVADVNTEGGVQSFTESNNIHPIESSKGDEVSHGAEDIKQEKMIGNGLENLELHSRTDKSTNESETVDIEAVNQGSQHDNLTIRNYSESKSVRSEASADVPNTTVNESNTESTELAHNTL